jgi:hypothetical protein
MLFQNGGNDVTLVSNEGEHLALEAEGTFLEPGVAIQGTKVVFSRTTAGWALRSLATSEMTANAFFPELFTPNLSQVAIRFYSALSGSKHGKLLIGPVGGSYSTMVSLPEAIGETRIVGANAGTASVPAFSDVVFASVDHALLPVGPEREAAEQAQPGQADLYEWAAGRLQLVNVDSEGKLVSPCGANLGRDTSLGEEPGNALDAVSADGSKIFFSSEAGPCTEEHTQLYMHDVDGETVDVSEPQGVSVPLPARSAVLYDGASTDGSKVFFTTATALTPEAGAGFRLYEYNSEAPAGHQLKLIASNVNGSEGPFNPYVVVSEDGSAVYYHGASTIRNQGQMILVSGIWRYETTTGMTSLVAVPTPPTFESEPAYATPDGQFYLFPSGNGGEPPVEVLGPHGLEPELRGAGHDELYRYDAADGSVTCVSCGEGVAPAKGTTLEPRDAEISFSGAAYPREALAMTDDGQRVFFNTSARLVPQDTNEDSTKEEKEGILASAGPLGVAADVYEWEADGTEEAPGVVCEQVHGCTHLISAGEAVGPERFLGASANGENVFFTSAAQLVPQATPEFTNIYDARVDGGFPPPSPRVRCTSCQGVGSPSLAFSASASETFMSAGNSLALPPPPPLVPRVYCARGRVRHHDKCVKIKKGHRSGLRGRR